MHKSLLLPLVFLAGCTSHAITSKTLSDAEIADIQSRVEVRYPELSTEKTQAVTELVVRALDNMVSIKGGTFMMGEFKIPCEPGSEQMCYSDFHSDNDYAHKVTLDDYGISKYETIIRDFDLFRELKGRVPYGNKIRDIESRQYLFVPDKPAWTKNWSEPKEYCTWIGELSGKKIDLPTEAQWEFAARNRGKNILYPTDNGEVDLGRNYRKDGEGDRNQEVGHFPPNPLGIYDLMGNAAEWVNDVYDPNYYKNSPVLNPSGPKEGDEHVTRGGTNANNFEFNTTMRRGHEATLEYYSDLFGFRCAYNY
ncbi:formylglycine-generating enzyme family protein [Marinobacter sp. C2H3]|uniref:formylglycine-generating enzyme family protein n=1 Tax=Marinobacter sp. C2H3 TaxID=3119003 RepID=UPI00300F414D